MAKAKLDYEVPAHLKREFVFQTAGVLPPNGLLFGFNTVQKVGAQAKALGGKQVLLVTDEVMVQLGYAELVKELLEKVLPEKTEVQNYIVEHAFPAIGRRKLLINARRVFHKNTQMHTILLAIEDVTDKGSS